MVPISSLTCLFSKPYLELTRGYLRNNAMLFNGLEEVGRASGGGGLAECDAILITKHAVERGLPGISTDDCRYM